MADPIIYNDKLWTSKGYANGSNAVVKLGSGQLRVDEAGEYRKTTLKNKENCSVFYEGYVYGINDGGGLVCVQFETGNVMWSTPASTFGTESAVMLADHQLVVMNGTDGAGDGDLVVVNATSTGYQEVHRTNDIISSSGNTWTTPTLANGRLYLRSQDGTLICFDVNGDTNSDGIADSWAQQYSITNAATDNDNDGYSNLGEYIIGSNPNSSNKPIDLSITMSNGIPLISCPTTLAAGTGYEGLFRWYDLLYLTNLTDSNWTIVPGCSNIPATGSPFHMTNDVADPTRFYRVQVRLD
jgi:outer membrane protein assembly factor BamB